MENELYELIAKCVGLVCMTVVFIVAIWAMTK